MSSTILQTVSTINRMGEYFAGGALCDECASHVRAASEDVACRFAVEFSPVRSGSAMLCGRCLVPGRAGNPLATVAYSLKSRP